MSRNLARTTCRTCESEVKVCGIPYKGAENGLWLANAECTACGTKYTAWIGPTLDGYGSREVDRNLVRDRGFYDLSYRSTFNDEPGEGDVPANVEVFRVVKIGDRQVWIKMD